MTNVPSPFALLAREAPSLWRDLQGKGAAVAAPRERQALAQTLRLAEAATRLRALRRAGARRLFLAGDPDLARILGAAGALEGFALTDGPGVDAARLHLDEDVPPLAAADIPFAVPEAWRGAYEDALGQLTGAMLRRLATLDPARTILFAGIYTYFNGNKLSLALRRRGMQTAHLCLNPSNQQHKHGFYDVVLDAAGNLEAFYQVLAAWRGRAVHFQGWLGLHCFAAAAAMVAGATVVTEFNDLPQYCFADEEFDRLFGPGSARAEREAVTLAMERASGVALNYVEGAAAPLLRDCPRAAPHIHLHSWPLPDLFADEPVEDRRALVFCGTLNPSHYPSPPFGDVQLLELARELTGQGLRFHILLNPYQDRGERGIFWDYEYLERKEPLFSLRRGLGPEALPRAIAGYGWGCMLHRFPEDFSIGDMHMRHMLPTKFFSYLEAGLPVLASRRIAAVARLVEENGLGLVVEEADLPRLGERIDAADYPALRRNVRRWRQAQALDNHLEPLCRLYGLEDGEGPPQ